MVRVSKSRDVALLKVTAIPAQFFTGTYVPANDPEVGDDLTVIGSPLDLSLSNTVTRGVL